MGILIVFAFLAGIITILSPCILPVLPIVLSGSVSAGSRRPYAIVAGFIASFTLFTLFLSSIIKVLGIPPDALRMASIAVVFIFGAVLLIPAAQKVFETLSSRLTGRVSGAVSANDTGLASGLLVGVSLGILWTPCVGPIIASVITLAATASVTAETFLITLAYSIGTAIPLLIIIRTGRSLLQRYLVAKSQGIQKAFGVLMIATAVMLFFQVDRTFQTYVLTVFPSYGQGLTAVEDNPLVSRALKSVTGNARDQVAVGRPMPEAAAAYPLAPEFIAGGQWFNSRPLTLASLRGKVVLVDFWTYTCINCIRTLPYLKNWYDKYHDRGLVIVGVHTPEFAFEKEAVNVRKAIGDFGIRYPVMQDNDYATWKAYDNHYWPAEYLIDTEGRIRHTHFGEGMYDETEQTIVKLLGEAGSAVSADIRNPAYDVTASTPELYVGYRRSEYGSSAEQVLPDRLRTYSAPDVLVPDHFAFVGPWTVSADYATPGKGAGLLLHYRAANVYMVAKPSVPGSTVTVRIEMDGGIKPADTVDVKNGVVTVTGDRLYTLTEQPLPSDHILKLTFPDGGVQFYTLTFG